MKNFSRPIGLGAAGLLIVTALVVPTTGALPLYWWVGPCNGALVRAEQPDAQRFSEDVQGDDPTGAAASFAAETAANGQVYAHCVAEGGLRVQTVLPGRTVDVKIVNCVSSCAYTQESLGGARHTLRCLDDNSVSTAVFPDSPHASHPCIVESTLELNKAEESVLVWRVSACNDPACTPWPQDILPSA